jgi:hypothetical protein
MDEETETKAIEKWLRMVDKPLTTREGDIKDSEQRDGKDDTKSGQPGGWPIK